MGKVLLSESAQTKLQADFYANEQMMRVASTTCFPVIAQDSGDFFFVAVVRPATQCNGVYREVVKVVATEGMMWTIERVESQCVRLAMDFRMGDLVYFEPHTAQQLKALSDYGARLKGDADKQGGFTKVTNSYQAKVDEKLIIKMCATGKTLRFPLNPKDGDMFCVLNVGAEVIVDTHGLKVNGEAVSVWDFACKQLVCFMFDADSGEWIGFIGGGC